MAWTIMTISCGGSNAKMKDLAREDILASLPYPDSTDIVEYSPCDSAFGVFCFTEKEVIEILTQMKTVSDYIMSKSDQLMKLDNSNSYLVNLTERHMEASMSIRSIIMNSQDKGQWTGWKMRVLYETSDKDHTRYRCYRWLFFNQDGTRVIKAFDIPII